MLSRFRLIPREERFFELFSRGAENLLEAANALLDLMENYSDVERKARRLKDIEHSGDEITHEIFDALNRTFVTPLDREDISHLTAALDDVVDGIEDVSRRMRIYKIELPTPLALRFARVIVDQAEIIHRAMPLLENLKDGPGIQKAGVEIHRLENEADDLFAEALTGAYEKATDIQSLLQCIRWNDIYEILEAVTDKAEDVANILQNIVVKNG